ncbi:MAG: hypothetical protein FGF48_06315 [Candidatus Brockarchaeota archaeon]|nr:hypothetical protein [Candidatus Brockarchaeota archaeon]
MKEYNNEIEMTSDMPDHLIMKVIKVVIEETKKDRKRVSMKMSNIPENIEPKSKSWKMLKQFIARARRAEENIVITRVK